MAGLDDILNNLPIEQIAAQFGIDPDTAKSAVQGALPALIGGLNANAQDEAGAEALSQALAKHDSSLIEGGVDLDQVDVADGEKILGHVFGDNRDQVASKLSDAPQLGGIGGMDMSKLMAMLAPVVMSFLTKQMQGGSSSNAAADSGPAGGLGDLLGGLLGGGGGGAGGLNIEDLLGGLLGKK